MITKNSPEKTIFLKDYAGRYGYDGKIDRIRDEEYPQLANTIYLDHAGTTAYAQSTFPACAIDLTSNLYGNPHSKSPSSNLTAQKLESVRTLILNHFNTTPGDYQVIFTQNATAAIKLVGECFPWTRKKSWLKYLRESHTSVIGLRAFAKENKVEFSTVNEDDIKDMVRKRNNDRTNSLCEDGQVVYNLFVYPAQCNFSGMRFPLSWTQGIKERFKSDSSRVLVLLDAASYVMTSQLSLKNTETSPDFVSISFYKMFGYPTGLGALLVKSELAPILRKRYFGGGTVSAVLYDTDYQQFRPSLSESFEDGTTNFLNIIALSHAFSTFMGLFTSFDQVTLHTSSLISYLYTRMSSLKHYNGKPVCKIFSSRDFRNPVEQGPVLNFNLKKADESWVGFSEVARLAGMHNIHLRVGGLCNPGNVTRWFNVSQKELMMAFQSGKVCGDDRDVINGKPIGSVRVSLGAMSTIDDVLGLIDFVREYFVETSPPVERFRTKHLSKNMHLNPIKSCKGFSTDQPWPISQQGLLYDREWMLIDAQSGRALRQTQYPRMALISPVIDLINNVLVISAPGLPSLTMRLNELSDFELELRESRICGDKINSLEYTSLEITSFFSKFLNVSCYLACQSSFSQRFIKENLSLTADAPLSLSNESPFLLVSQKSFDYLKSQIGSEKDREVDLRSFRGNFVIEGAEKAYEEDDWKLLRIGEQFFEILGPCTRCQMICINQDTGERTRDLYSSLVKWRSTN
ncbi:1709_t:CDS:2, partial [Paraglomus occultum]